MTKRKGFYEMDIETEEDVVAVPKDGILFLRTLSDYINSCIMDYETDAEIEGAIDFMNTLTSVWLQEANNPEHHEVH